jgi:hypothetical protein
MKSNEIEVVGVGTGHFTTGGRQLFRAVDPVGTLAVAVLPDGTVEFGSGFAPSEEEQEFWAQFGRALARGNAQENK